MDRKAYWYSVVLFQPSILRGEKINVGLIFHCPSDGRLMYRLLNEDNFRIKSFLSDSALLKVYRTHREYLEYFFEHVAEDLLNMVGEIQGPDILSENFLSDMSKILPETLFLSEPTFAMTHNLESLFDAMLEQYIGRQFLRSEEKPTSTKTFVKNCFEERQLIGTKIKSNVKLHPIKDIPAMRFQIDFVFKNGVWNLIQTLPTSPDRITEWFSKTQTMLGAYQTGLKFYIVLSSEHPINQDKTVRQMVKFLKLNDKRVSEVDIESKSFKMFCNKIELEAKDISSLEDELIAM